MNKRVQRLEPVKALREKQVTEEAKRLAQAYQAYQSALNQLAELEGYLKEYYASATSGQMAFNSAIDLIRYQQFVVKINEAIKRQRDFANIKEVGYKGAQKRWIDAKSRVDAIDKLMSKAIQDAEKKENKREQRLADEFAARLFAAQAARSL